MQRVLRNQTTTVISKDSRAQITVLPGEVFEAETELSPGGGWLTSIDVVLSPGMGKGVNPTVVVAVEGAKPGDSICVHIHSIVPDKLGYTGFSGTKHTLANSIIGVPDYDWGQNLRTVGIEDGFVNFAPNIKLPISPMIGTMGTAPKGDGVDNSRGGPHGGNMDSQDLRAGAKVTFPVEVPGALLHIGDMHAIQGDGELCWAGGIECQGLVTMHIDIVKRPYKSECIRVENDEEICAIACHPDMDVCIATAIREILNWICHDYRLDEKEAYLLLGQLLILRVPQLVNPTRTITAAVKKRFLTGL